MNPVHCTDKELVTCTMDPLSIFGTCACIVSLLSYLKGIANSVRGTPKDISSIIHEMDSIKKALELVPPAATALPQISDILKNCNKLVKQIQRSIRKHIKGTFITGIRWASAGKDEMTALRSSIEAHKASINTALSAVHM